MNRDLKYNGMTLVFDDLPSEADMPARDGIPMFVEIRRNSDGLVRKYHDPNLVWYDDGSRYIWSEGNFSCDCNRALFFACAADEEDPDTPCGDTAYSVRVVSDGGVEQYADENWPRP